MTHAQGKALDVRTLLRDSLGVLFKRKKLILCLFLIVAVAISVSILSIPNSYEVTGKLFVTRARGDLLISPNDPKNFNYNVTAPSIQDMAVHAEMLKNRSLVEAVVRQLNLDRPNEQAKSAEHAKAGAHSQPTAATTPAATTPAASPSMLDAFLQKLNLNRPKAEAERSSEAEANVKVIEASAAPASAAPASAAPASAAPASASIVSGPSTRFDGIVDNISNGFNVQVLANSNLILVKYRNSDATKGALILNTLLDEYLDQYVKLHARPGITDFFTEHRDRVEQKLRASESALLNFQRRAGLL